MPLIPPGGCDTGFHGMDLRIEDMMVGFTRSWRGKEIFSSQRGERKVCLCTVYVPGAFGDQKTTLEPLELELQLVNCPVGPGN
ncbi:mCG59525 [Mus musculus]|nr:mCG59525 [Mus musculus]